MKKIFTLLFSGLSFLSYSQSTTVVISQAYGGGGATTGSPTYKNDYAELHNISTATVDISGYSIQYGSATGKFGSTASNIYEIPAGTTIEAGKYLLIQFGSAGTLGADLPVTPDLITTNITMSASSGKLALSNQAAALNCGADTAMCVLPSSAIVDLVAYGIAKNAEGGVAVDTGKVLTSVLGIARKSSGCQDSDNNNDDFDVITNPVPHNSASAVSICTTLPLSLTSFKASLKDGAALLQWTSQNEINVKGFSIEKSINGTTFGEIGFVNAANSAPAKTYTFDDNKVKSIANYYRLKLIDNDGAARFSSVVFINNKVGLKAEVFPNPTSQNITLVHAKAFAGAYVSIVNVLGTQVKAFAVQQGAIQSGIMINDLPTGTYFLMFVNKGEKSVTRFVKQ